MAHPMSSCCPIRRYLIATPDPDRTMQYTFSPCHARRCSLAHAIASAFLACGLADVALAHAGESIIRGQHPRTQIAATAASRGDVHPDGPRGDSTVFVQNCSDAGPGSLRDAYANSFDGLTIDLGQLNCSTITLANGALVSADNSGYVTLKGPLGGVLIIDANHASRAIIHRGGRIALHDLIVKNGFANNDTGGGCILSEGDVVLSESRVSGCEVSTTGTTPALGGAIRSLGVTFVISSQILDSRAHAAAANADGGGVHAQYVISAHQSTISGNVASGDGSHYARGGGAYGREGMRIDDCTMAGNQATSGGAAFIGSASFHSSRFVDSTISNNSVDGAGGGIHSNFSVEVDNSTIVGNQAYFDFGAGLYLAAGSAQVHSTIIAGNTTGDGLNAADIGGHAGATLSGDHNLVLASTLTLPPDTINQQPMLGPLQDNGGGVATMALLPGSPAIDTGANPRNLYEDGRGYECPPTGRCTEFERTVGAATDIGAYEFGAPNHIFGDSFEMDALAGPG
jgi:hypothetical protein